MIKKTVNNIIVNGINNFSSRHETIPEKTQIRVYYDEDLTVSYDCCIDYQPKEKVTFKQILNKKIDLMQMETLATPVFKKSLSYFSKNFDVDTKNISVFIIYLKSKVSLCVFNKNKHIHLQSLDSHLKELGI